LLINFKEARFKSPTFRKIFVIDGFDKKYKILNPKAAPKC